MSPSCQYSNLGLHSEYSAPPYPLVGLKVLQCIYETYRNRRLACHGGHVLIGVFGSLRSHKEKRSSYAPEAGVRYDGVYRIEKCWRKKGIQVITSLVLLSCLNGHIFMIVIYVQEVTSGLWFFFPLYGSV